MIKKLYKWTAIIISAHIGIEARSITEMLYALFYFFITYIVLKALYGYMKRSIQSAGGPLRWLIRSADTTHYDKQIFNSVNNAFRSSGNSGTGAWNAKAAADQRVWKRTKAANEAMFHQHQANQNKGTYDGYRSQNLANNARNRANRY